MRSAVFLAARGSCRVSRLESERIVFAPFSRVYDTFSLFLRRFSLREVSSEVRKYRFCPFFMGLRYVFTFPAMFQLVRGLMRGQKVSFLPVFFGFTIRSHFSCGVSACAGPPAESESIVFARFFWVYDTFSLFLQRFWLRGASCGVRKYRFCPFFMGLRYVLTLHGRDTSPDKPDDLAQACLCRPIPFVIQ